MPGDGMKKKDAKRLLSTLELKVSNSGEYALAPTNEELDRFESEFELVLPSSYRVFVSVFGPGELAGVFRIAVPYCKVASFDLAKEIESHKKLFRGRTSWIRRQKYADPDKVERLCVFSTTYRGEKYGFDPEEVTSKRPREYPIYLLTRMGDAPEKISDTFESFVTEYCLGKQFLEVYSDEVRSMTFCPAYIRKKRE